MNRIGRYQLLDTLGRGGMGAVYRARDAGSGQEVALKVLTRGLDASPQQRQRFEREARALAKVEHPNVVRLLDVGEDRGGVYLVMELHAEGSLEQQLARGLLEPRTAAFIGAQLASGLAAAHAKGVLHRDLKPGNVLLGANGRALLTDFGLAKDLEREGVTQALTQSGAFLGTPGYWAPEQATGQLALVGPATDVYGLGAILFTALSGRPPIVGEHFMEIAARTAQKRPPRLSSLRAEVPPALEAIVERCLEKDPSARWESAEALCDALHEFLDEDSAAPRLRGSIGLALAMGSLGLVLAGVGVGAMLSSKIEPKGVPSSLASATPDPEPAPEPERPEPTPTPSGPSATALFEQGWSACEKMEHQKGAALFRRAAERGYGRAMTELGNLFANGRGVAFDAVEAVRWYRQAAEAGNPEGMNELGNMLRNGRGVVRDDAKAAEWYRRAAEKGSPLAMASLAVVLQEGVGVAKDLAQAVKWYRAASEKGYVPAMVKLGNALARGDGVAMDEAKAAGWYRRAAQGGDPTAMHNLGVMLALGSGVKQDEAEAVKWLRRAAQGKAPNIRRMAQAALQQLGR